MRMLVMMAMLCHTGDISSGSKHCLQSGSDVCISLSLVHPISNWGTKRYEYAVAVLQVINAGKTSGFGTDNTTGCLPDVWQFCSIGVPMASLACPSLAFRRPSTATVPGTSRVSFSSPPPPRAQQQPALVCHTCSGPSATPPPLLQEPVACVPAGPLAQRQPALFWR